MVVVSDRGVVLLAAIVLVVVTDARTATVLVALSVATTSLTVPCVSGWVEARGS